VSASSSQGQVAISSSFYLPATQTVGADVGTHVLIIKSLSANAPGLMKGKWGTALNVASLLAAPFTGGGSLAANAALRGGAVAVQGGRAALAGKKAAQAGKGLSAARGTQQAALANKPPKVAVRRGSGATTQAARRKTDAAVRSGQQAQIPGMETVDPTDVGGGRPQGFEAVNERALEAPQSSVEMPQDMSQETLSVGDQQGTFPARQQLETAEAHKDKMDAQHGKMKVDYDKEWNSQTGPMAMASTGAVGVSQVQGRNQANQAKQQAEMERVQNIAEDGRANATTGKSNSTTGGKVAVAA
jgi:hypothetical protein